MRTRLWITKALGLIIALSLLGYLLRDALSNHLFQRVAEQPKNWSLLGLAFLLTIVNTFAAIGRWFVLLNALRFKLDVRDAVRVGLQGNLLNYLALGGLGEDAYKAFLLARQQRRRRGMAALLSVFIDRVLGIYALILIGSIGVLCLGFYQEPYSTEVRLVSVILLIAAVASTIVIGVCYAAPVRWMLRITHPLFRLRIAGKAVRSAVQAFIAYRRQPTAMLLATAISLAIHSIWILVFFLIAEGIGINGPTLAQHIAVVPISVLTMILPLPLEALGAFDLALSHLYEATSGSDGGLIIALGYRVLTITAVIVPLILVMLLRRRCEPKSAVSVQGLPNDLSLELVRSE